ncbi:hypothetical protein BgAZ_203640 [Babesia gibsoni]|uniref:Elongation factor P C-terminal domain-containing protein n=1 Tax=Babesia gibsoni TaxID=33632 RepID=A0AAD8LL19_BABGI|nr:hypothetical protein BgAZ_203640 [Babesia gibsoni]
MKKKRHAGTNPQTTAFLPGSHHYRNCCPLSASKYSDIDPSKLTAKEKKKVAQLIMEEEHVKLIEQLLAKVPPDTVFSPKKRSNRMANWETKEEREVKVVEKRKDLHDTPRKDDDEMDVEEPTHINKVRASAFVLHRGEVHVVLSSQHVAQARSRGHYKVKMRNLLNNKEITNSFPDGAKLSVLTPNKVPCVYKGIDPQSGQHLFQTEHRDYLIPKTSQIQTLKYVKLDLRVTLSCWKGQVIGLFVPYQIQYKVVHVNPGNFAATLENGLVVMVPTYIKEGDLVDINTAKGEFLRRSILGQ